MCGGSHGGARRVLSNVSIKKKTKVYVVGIFLHVGSSTIYMYMLCIAIVHHNKLSYNPSALATITDVPALVTTSLCPPHFTTHWLILRPLLFSSGQVARVLSSP